ncbi:sugar-binding transcriptional regulator [Clostridium sp. 'White wine YQ']|uniref:sugar-binding transcriptional regulator n=1 Tax=Clostridium sp. 'White wine YQ' TaxID=3027474 RepID=UPI002365EA4D|nr:sugar-binding domain-containing protein [Clostridium sp. 'White wine YQ']MDD7792824.1 sugar-binding domain-containing protein [Clostridium sp. 'White wine YQ']
MQNILRLLKNIVPELVDVLEKRYNILRTIYYYQPIGRRILANKLNLSERIVRTEVNFLKAQNLIQISTPGMSVTTQGEKVVEELKDFIHEIKGLADVEQKLSEILGLRKVIVVPGDIEADPSIIKELGKAAANYAREIIKNRDVVAITGGSTIKEVVENFPKVSNVHDVLVVPARGGMGKKVETQASTLAAELAYKLNGSYKMLHVPDNLSGNALDTLLKEREIKEIIDSIHKSNVLIYGIGIAEEMAEKRGLTEAEKQKIRELKAVGEAFGCYFNKEGEVVFISNSIGITYDVAKKIGTHIAVAGGKNKVEAILATENTNEYGVLVTDEGAATNIIKYFESNE